MTTRPLYQQFATSFTAYQNCIKDENNDSPWEHIWECVINDMTRYHMPRGSGFDGGVDLSLRESKEDKLVFYTSYHHMDEHGSYDGWSDWRVTVTPSLQFGYKIRAVVINGRRVKSWDRDYIVECLDLSLSEMVDMGEYTLKHKENYVNQG